MVEDELKFDIKTILCHDCRHFKDTGVRSVIQYNHNKSVVKGRVHVRYYCKAYCEYLSKFYSFCKRFDSVYGRSQI